MKWADKVDLMEAGRASDEAVASVMSPWARSNLQLRADRDFINETARLAAEAAEAVEPMDVNRPLTPSEMKAEQQIIAQWQAEAAAWK